MIIFKLNNRHFVRDLFGTIIIIVLLSFVLLYSHTYHIEQKTVLQYAIFALSLFSMTIAGFQLRRQWKITSKEVILWIFLCCILVLSVFSKYSILYVCFKLGIVINLYFVFKIFFEKGSIRLLYMCLIFCCLCEIIYGISDIPQNIHGICGHFDNPAGLAATIVVLFPFTLFLIYDKYTKIYGYVAIVIFVLGIVLSKSRAGLLSVCCMVLIYCAYSMKERFLKLPRIKRLFFYGFAPVSIVTFLFLLYSLNRDSANGRLLIWHVSTDMFVDKPFWGHGANCFDAEYMENQANYFMSHTDSKYSYLADNVKQPFNIYVGILLEYGISGFILFTILLAFFLKRKWSMASNEEKIALLSLFGLSIFGFFSYPLYYLPVFILVIIDLLILAVRSNKVVIPSIPFYYFFPVLATIFCIGIFSSAKTMELDREWRTLKSKFRTNVDMPDILTQYECLYALKQFDDPLFLYNYGAVLHACKKYQQSIAVLSACKTQMDDFDVRIILTDSYFQEKDYINAEYHARIAYYMCPSRFISAYYLVLAYTKNGKMKLAKELAEETVAKPVKIKNTDAYKIKLKLKQMLKKGLIH